MPRGEVGIYPALETNLLFQDKLPASPLGASVMPTLESDLGQFWPFPYLAFFSSYRTRFDLVAARRGRGPTVGVLHNLGTHIAHCC